MDDAQLVQRAATCDLEAFAHVYDRHAAHLHDFLGWVLQDRGQAEDALYNTFVEAGSRIHELADPTKLRPWLFAVASREALRRRDHGNGNGHGKANGNGAAAASAPEANGDPSWNGLVEVVRGVGEELSPRDRAIIDLKYRQGLGDDDLGAALGTDPDSAASLVERVTAQVEETLGDTVVAYLGQKDCPELQAAMGEFDGHLTERQRQIVEQHIAGCERCGPRHARQVGVPALLRVVPVAPLPAEVTARVLDDVQLAAHTGRPWPASRNGFPPPVAQHDYRRWYVAVAAALILLLGAAGLILTRDDGKNEQVAAVGTTVAARTASTATTRLVTTTVAAATTTVATEDPNAANSPGTTTARPATTVRAATPTTAGTSGGGGTGTGTGSGSNTGSNSSTNTTETPATTAPTTTQPPDTIGPSLSGLSASTAAVRPTGRPCSNSDPLTATISVSASDPSGVSSVSVTYAGVGGGGATPMGATGGGTYSATIGPFETPAAIDNVPGTVLVRATDGAGNTSTAQGSLAIRCTA